MASDALTHQFVDAVPDGIDDDILYVSMPFRTTVHLCACGCRNEVWLPIRPNRHHLTFDGATITVHGSVGNWEFPCRSHYWIPRNRIVWDGHPTGTGGFFDRLLRRIGIRC